MVRVCYIDVEGNRHDVELEIGISLMEGAYSRSIPGILADCGGACACATCHVYIESEYLDKLPPPDEIENAMLETSINRKNNSRLSCQITVDSGCEGLVVRVADNRS